MSCRQSRRARTDPTRISLTTGSPAFAQQTKVSTETVPGEGIPFSGESKGTLLSCLVPAFMHKDLGHHKTAI